MAPAVSLLSGAPGAAAGSERSGESRRPAAARGAAETRPSSALTRRSGGAVRCLLVDDDEAVLELLRTWLRAYDVEVATARSGEEALLRVAERPVDLLVTDLVMEGLDGIELLRRLERSGARPPMLGITGVPGGESLGQAMTALGAEAFLLKPFDRAQFLGALRSALGRDLDPA